MYEALHRTNDILEYMILIDGKKEAALLREQLKKEVSDLKIKYNKVPGLTVILIGDLTPSQIYVRNKEKSATEVGLKSDVIKYPDSVEEKVILEKINELNKDNSVSGILVQLPLPKHIDKQKIIEAIDPSKDVDGFHPTNLGRLVMGQVDGMLPCTPAGVMELIKDADIDLTGKKAVVIGRSRIVGMPLALLLAQKGIDATVTIAHSRTQDIADICRTADLVVAAIGRAETIQADWIKPGATVIDVGINRVADDSRESGSRLTGDVEPEAVNKAGYITPVPGGVGPMTISMLMSNTVKAAELRLN